MTRTVMTPINNNIVLPIPDKYIGKKIEILFYAVEELTEEVQVKKNTMAKYKGIISAEVADQLQQNAKQSREEWERNI